MRLALKVLGCHVNVANHIWFVYLNKTDRLLCYLACHYLHDGKQFTKPINLPEDILKTLVWGSLRYGYVYILEWLRIHNYNVVSAAPDDMFYKAADKLMFEAAKYGQNHVLRWFQIKLNIRPSNINIAVSLGMSGLTIHLEQFMAKHKPPSYKDSFQDIVERLWSVALGAENIKLLQWLYTHHYRLNGEPGGTYELEVLFGAFDGRNKEYPLRVFEFLKQNNIILFEKTDMVADFAAEYGLLKAVQWLVREGYPIADCIMKYIKVISYEIDGFELIQWLYSLGYPLIPSLYYGAGYVACKTGNCSMLEWLFKNGCPFKKSIVQNLLYYIQSNKLPSITGVQWLVDRGCPTTPNDFNTLLSITAAYGESNTKKRKI